MNFPRWTMALMGMGVISIQSVYWGQNPLLIDW